MKPSRPCGSSPRTWGTDPGESVSHGVARFIPTHVGNSQRPRLHYHLTSGSSPRTWGTGYGHDVPALVGRFIPTHVGNSCSSCARSSLAAVHPHARGEQIDEAGGSHAGFGSSPRTWGTGVAPPANRICQRFIPTHVGNRGCRPVARAAVVRFIPTHVGNRFSVLFLPLIASVHPHARGEQGGCGECSGYETAVHPHARGDQPASRQQRPAQPPVHPHARGEQFFFGAFHELSHGSSPRTWGTVRSRSSYRLSIRFIPTHVGNRCSLMPHLPADTVHPHARGEQVLPSTVLREIVGSSPRTWGTVQGQVGRDQEQRFIPTHVGNRLRCKSSQCGQRGSSPRTWGTDHQTPGTACGRRFIPTHVGNSWSRSAPARPGTVHPHARGEQISSEIRSPSRSGSSPRTWGTDSRQAQKWGISRFNPTHVGNRATPGQRLHRGPVHPHARGEQIYTTSMQVASHGSSPRTWGTAR